MLTKSAAPLQLLKSPLPPRSPSFAWIGQRRDLPRALAAEVVRFQDSDDFLLSANAYDFDFYVVELTQQGVRGIDLVRLIRRRSMAGIVALGDEEEFVQALEFGADMVLRADAPADHLVAGVAAVRRRLQPTSTGTPVASRPWTLLEARGMLQAPDGTEIALSESDLAILRCFADAEGAKVERRTLIERLWGPDAAPAATENALHATLYRLRKRIEQAGQPFVPVHAVARVGYEFRAPLVRGQ